MGQTTGDNSFSAGRDPWLARLGHLRNTVRQEVVARQLDAHLPGAFGDADDRPLRVLDVGAGQGTQAIRLAGLGHVVTAVEPDPHMRAAFEEATAALEDGTRQRVALLAGDLAELASVTSPAAYDLVLCHGVLMYLAESRTAIATLARCAAPGAVVSVVARNGDALAWRPSVRHDWEAAVTLLEEQERAVKEHRDPFYRNEIGVQARGDRIADLLATFEDAGLQMEGWYGVRVATDDVSVETHAPAPDELARIVEVEERLGRTDPYRHLGTLVHVIGRAPRRT
jgi:SAM-dependent methyltransferase